MSTDTLPSGGGRRMEARRRRAKQRRRAAVAGGLALVLLLVVGAVLLVTGGEDATDDGGGTATARTQRTLLLQVRAANGNTTSNVLLAHDPSTSKAAGILVPPTVLASPPGSQAVPFQQVLRQTSPALARDALTDLLGVTIDASWVLSAAGLSALVDAVGGIDVDVDVQVLGGAGNRQVLLAPGPQALTGATALVFAGYLAESEPEPVRLARLQAVLDALVRKLPDGEPQLRARLDALGVGSVVDGTDVPGLARLLLGLRSAEDEDALLYDTLPVLTVETGAATPSLRVGPPEALTALVDRLLADSVPLGVREGNNRVKVFNGVGTPMLGNAVRAKLVRAGLVFVGSANASRFGVQTSEVQIGEATPESQALGERVANALGLPLTAVRSSDPTSVADVIVVIGADFQP